VLDSTVPQPGLLGPAPLAFEVITRFELSVAERSAFQGLLEVALERLGAEPGFLGGWLGQGIDDVRTVVLVTRWTHVGDWRRAMSRPDIKRDVVPLLYRCRDEPTAFEVVRECLVQSGEPAHRSGQSGLAADADSAAPGSAAGDRVESTWQA